MPRSAFFAGVRHSLFGGRLTRAQVTGMETILDEWDRRRLADLRWLAYMLATTFHETARTMQPIREYGGEAYFRRMYDLAGDRPHVARALGNTEPGDGARFCGRGFVQLTGRTNYARMAALTGRDLVARPDLALDPEIATEILFEGMIGGLFTGRALADYFNAGLTDWRGARRIVNGLDRADLIAGYGRSFHAAAQALPAPERDRPVPETRPGRTGDGLLAGFADFLRAVLTGGRA